MNQTTQTAVVGRLLNVATNKKLSLGRLAVGLLVTLAFAAAGFHLWFPIERVANDTVIMPLSPPSSTAWTTENAFPSLKFFEPTCVVRHPASGRVFILERRGTVQVIQDDPSTQEKQQVVDVSDQVWRTPFEDDGAMGIVLHPEFGQEGSTNQHYLYLFYTAKQDGVRYDRLSRFTWKDGRAEKETILIDQRDDDLWHNGGALAFGSDGFLYVGVGDEGTNGDGLGNGQRIDRDFFCGLLRIDVDRRGGEISHAPPRQPETGRTAHYFVPNDNPFVGVPGVLEEFWAHGLRNPFRISFDDVTGRLWAADVGHLRREEINLIERGGNYGWSYREGNLPFTESYLGGSQPQPFYGEEKRPFRDYPHINGDNCIIGGFVYRGDQYPELSGKYLYGDNGSGRVWAIEFADGNAGKNVELLSLPVSSKTGVSAIVPGTEGEPWIVVLGESDTTSGTIHRIVRAKPESKSTLPATLSATGLFADLADLTPHDGVLEYGVNAGQSVGGATVRRWVLLPGNGQDPDVLSDRIEFSREGAWKFPTGSIFIQHFEMPGSETLPTRRLETRVLVRHAAGGVYGATYRWNRDGTEAELLTEPASENLSAARQPEGGGDRWHFLSSQSCLACHNQNAGYVLGVNARQLSRTFRQPGKFWGGDQLSTWSQLGMFHQPLTAVELADPVRLVDTKDESANLDLRARSFLDVNCACCHRPGGARASFYADFQATAGHALAAVRPSQGNFGIEDAKIVAAGSPYRSILYYRLAKLGPGRMPLVGSQRLDLDGLELIREWIESMPAEGIDPSLASEAVDQALSDDNSSAVIEQLLTDTETGFAIWQQVQDGRLQDGVVQRVVAAGLDSSNSAVRDLFEWLVPPSERTQRLGTNFDPTAVLALAGDADAGRELFLNLEGLDCRGCHGLQPHQKIVGPSLSGVGSRYDREQMLLHVINPSEKIDDVYRSWILETAAGRVFTGLKVTDNDNAVVLIDATGKEVRVTRDEVDFLEPLPKSLMPENLLQALTAQQAADLLEFLRSMRNTDQPAPVL